MNPYLKHDKNETPVTEPMPGKAMVPNSGGGFTFALGPLAQLRRFLVLGTEGNTYYLTERQQTVKNVAMVEALVASDPAAVLREVVDITVAGRALKKDPAIYTLALLLRCQNVDVRREAALAVPKVCSIGTDILTLAATLKALGSGFSPVIQRAMGAWYTEKDPARLAYQVVKYQDRSGFRHRDVLRLAKPRPERGGPTDRVLGWVTKGTHGEGPVEGDPLAVIEAFEQAKRLDASNAGDRKTLTKLVTDWRLPWECVPSEALNHADVWEALVPSMGATALVRNLGKMSSVGYLRLLSDGTKAVCAKLTDAEFIRSNRLHPLRSLIAMKVYGQGRGVKGDNTWTVVPQVLDALGEAFEAGFATVRPTGKKHLLAIDISGSMASPMSATPISCAEACAALALLRARLEEQYVIVGFGNAGGGMYSYGEPKLVDLGITAKTSLRDALARVQGPFGSTDASLPMRWALENKIEVDVVEVYTDNEVNAGVHPTGALNAYRQKMGREVRQVVCGMTATSFTIADPADPHQLDCVGFDAALPEVINTFVAA